MDGLAMHAQDYRVEEVNAVKKFRLTMSRKRMLIGILFISPWLIGFLYFYVRTLFMTGEFSLSEISIASDGRLSGVVRGA